jgi:hypothetical protein
VPFNSPEKLNARSFVRLSGIGKLYAAPSFSYFFGKPAFVYKSEGFIYIVRDQLQRMAKQAHNFTVRLSAIQMITIAAACILIILSAVITASSENVRLDGLGLFCQLLGAILLGLGLIKTNDELIGLIRHHERLDKPGLAVQLARDRFFVVLGIFLLALGAMLQIVHGQL